MSIQAFDPDTDRPSYTCQHHVGSVMGVVGEDLVVWWEGEDCFFDHAHHLAPADNTDVAYWFEYQGHRYYVIDVEPEGTTRNAAINYIHENGGRLITEPIPPTESNHFL